MTMATANRPRARLAAMPGPTSATATATGRPEFDLLDPAFYQADPHPALTWMRANEPL